MASASFLEKGWAQPSNSIQSFMSLLPAQLLHNRRRKEMFLVAGVALALITMLVTYAHLNVVPTFMASTGDNNAQGHSRLVDNGTAEVTPGPLIPEKIWQIFLTARPGIEINPDNFQDTKSWIAKNPDYKYTLVGSKGGEEFVSRHWGTGSAIWQTYNELKNPGLKSDLLRYLLLWKEGGTYSDTDTVAFKGVDAWVPKQYLSKTRVIVGIEFDRLDGPEWGDIPHDLQFCQWTIAAAPGHHLFERMTQRAVRSLRELTQHYNTTLPKLEATSFEVMNSTGPAAWTDAVFEELQTMDPSLKNVFDLSGMTEPRLIGDILVLPIDGFGMGQPHSNSSPADGPVPEQALVRHMFHGSWRDAEGSRHEDQGPEVPPGAGEGEEVASRQGQ
jgi:alpha 1,6-mannosyltransferase